MTDHKQFKTIYEDKDVLINENEIQIKWYFFPTASSKIIPFSKIKHVEFGGLDLLSGQGRLWGMSVGKWGYWFAGDSQRMSRNHFIAIHTNSSVKKAFTTQNDRQVYELIYKLWKQHQDGNHGNGQVSQLSEQQSHMVMKQSQNSPKEK